MERGEAIAEALSRGRRARGTARGKLKREGDPLRSAFRHYRRRSAYDARAAYERYVREHIWGEPEREHERGGLER